MLRNYYKLWELSANSEATLEGARNPFYITTQGMYSYLSGLYLIATGQTKSLGTDTTYTTKLLKDYIWPSDYEHYVCYLDKYSENKPRIYDTDHKDYSNMMLEFIGKVYTWLQESQSKYEKIISLYEAQANNLLNKIESISVNKFNDTPQNNAIGYDDTHTTTASQTVNSSDISTLMSRLNEIRFAWDNIYKEWANEFRAFVITLED